MLAPILPEKWRDLTWLHIVPKFNTCTPKKNIHGFKMVMLTPKLGIEN